MEYRDESRNGPFLIRVFLFLARKTGEAESRTRRPTIGSLVKTIARHLGSHGAPLGKDRKKCGNEWAAAMPLGDNAETEAASHVR